MTPMAVTCTHVHMLFPPHGLLHLLPTHLASAHAYSSLVLASWGGHTKRYVLPQDTVLTHQGPTRLPPLLPDQRTFHGRHQAWLDRGDLRALVFWL